MKKRMTLGKELMASFAAMLVLSMLLGAFAIVGPGELQRILETQVNTSARKTDLIGQLTTSLAEMKGSRQFLLAATAADTSGAEQERQVVKTSSVRVDRLLADIEPLLSEARGQQLFHTLRDAHQSWVNRHQDLTQRCNSCHTAGATGTETGKLERVAAELAQMQRQSLEAASGVVRTRVSTTRWVAVGLEVLCLVVCAVVLYVVRRSTKSLRKTAGLLSEASEQAAAATRQVTDANVVLERSAAEQSRSVETTSTTAEELAAMTQRNAEHSRQSSALMARVAEGVQSANSTLRGLNVSMDEIAASSSKISGIIKVIDGIAFQTNILALNAAVEAARAGEAGLGFAVVASEVRNLAQRSAQAAKDTAGLIEESVARSLEGKTRLDEVIKSVQEITERSAEVEKLVEGVNVGSQEQAQGIEEIARAVRQMEQHVHQLSESVGGLALAGEQMSSQTANVENGVSRLRRLVDGV